MHRAFAPVTDRLDPCARAALVTRLEILIGVKVALMLQQPEAARVVVNEGADLKVGRIVKRAPDLFATPVLDAEPIGVVYFGTEIVDPATIVGAEEVHAGQRREPYLL